MPSNAKMIGIQGKAKGDRSFRPFNYREGYFVNTLFHATLWPSEHREHVAGLVDYLNKHNPGFTFRVVTRG